jgi:hypothetical protein
MSLLPARAPFFVLLPRLGLCQAGNHVSLWENGAAAVHRFFFVIDFGWRQEIWIFQLASHRTEIPVLRSVASSLAPILLAACSQTSVCLSRWLFPVLVDSPIVVLAKALPETEFIFPNSIPISSSSRCRLFAVAIFLEWPIFTTRVLLCPPACVPWLPWLFCAASRIRIPVLCHTHDLFDKMHVRS